MFLLNTGYSTSLPSSQRPQPSDWPNPATTTLRPHRVVVPSGRFNPRHRHMDVIQPRSRHRHLLPKLVPRDQQLVRRCLPRRHISRHIPQRASPEHPPSNKLPRAQQIQLHSRHDLRPHELDHLQTGNLPQRTITRGLLNNPRPMPLSHPPHSLVFRPYVQLHPFI